MNQILNMPTLPIPSLIVLALVAYMLSLSIAGSALFHPLRLWIVGKSPWMIVPGFAHPIMCRMCVGFWATLAVTFIYTTGFNLADFLSIYGLSFFIASQERRS
ncbi:MAG: hypothetical protein ACOYL3_16170 [Desulfuromonadaceae bacterium]